jgi:hypothetical protein
LTAAEYPAVRDWIINDNTTAASIRPVCAELDAAAATPVIRAISDACDRFLAVLIDYEQVQTNIADNVNSDCGLEDFACRAKLLAGLQNDLINFKRILAAYYSDIDNAMSSGPCRDVLTPADGLAEADQNIEMFDRVVTEFSQGDTQALLALQAPDSGSQDISDPTPCKPQ